MKRFILCTALWLSAPLLQAAQFTVNNESREGDTNPGDGICEISSGAGDCSLMAAIEEASALGGAHDIDFDASVGYVDTNNYDLTGADINIQGPGREQLLMLVPNILTLQNDTISGVTMIIGDNARIVLAGNATLNDNRIVFSYTSNTDRAQIAQDGTSTGPNLIDNSELIGSNGGTNSLLNMAGGTLTLRDSLVRDNLMDDNSYSNAVINHIEGELTIERSEFRNNRSPSGGGIVIKGGVSAGSLIIRDSLFIENQGSSGGLNSLIRTDSATARFEISGSRFTGNATYQGMMRIRADEAWISDTSITGNTDSRACILLLEANNILLKNVTVSDNDIVEVVSAGFCNVGLIPVSFAGGATARVINTTITNNRLLGSSSPTLGFASSAGLLLAADTVIKNSIIANNSNEDGGNDCVISDINGNYPVPTVTSAGYNIIGDNDAILCGIAATTGDVFGTTAAPVDAMLAALAEDPVSGRSYRRPLPGSPALDGGENGGACNDDAGVAISTDMLGNPRPVDGDNDGVNACDIGAYEVQPDTTPDAFSFGEQNDVGTGIEIVSDTITVSGIDVPVAISVSDGEYRINAGVFTAVAGTVSNGDTVQVRHTSAALNSTRIDTVLNVGSVSDTFSSTTVDDEADNTNTQEEVDNTIVTDGGGGGNLSPWFVALLLLPLFLRRVGQAGIRRTRCYQFR